MNNGREATIISYRRNNDIDVSFMDGKCIAKNRTYSCFCLGKIECPMFIEDMGGYLKVTNYDAKTQVTFLISKEDEYLLDGKMWRMDVHGYMVNKVRGALHRAVMLYPKGIEIDHINRDKLDNRRENLRLCNSQQNKHNMASRRGTTSPYKGVTLHKGKWVAEIRFNGKKKYLGRYMSEVEAAIIYNQAAKSLFGEFAYLNSIPGGA